MPAVFQKTVEQDLHKPLKIQYCADTVFTKDNTGNLINVLLFEDGVPYNGGGTVSATAIRADGATESWAGTISGNTVSVALTRAALDVPGTLQVFIKVTAGTVETTVYAGVYNVVCTETPTVVAPVTPSDVAALIASIEAAIRNIPADWTSFLGTIAPTFDPGKTGGYAAGDYVWYPGQTDNVGTLYRFTSAHSGTWTGTDAVTVVIGNELNDTVRYTQQIHTDAEKTIARSNIGAASADQLFSLGYQVSVNTTDIDVIQRTIGSGLDPNNTVKSQLDGIKADIGTVPDGQNLQGEVSDLKSAISVLEPTATAEDEGKALIVKTVTSGKVSEYEFGTAGEGLTEEIKVALLNCFQHVAWIDEHGQDYYNALENALYQSDYPKIIASLNSGVNVFFLDDTLDIVKNHITVKYCESMGSGEVIVPASQYEITGTLIVGASVLTISYNGLITYVSVLVCNDTVPSGYTKYDYISTSSQSSAGSIATVQDALIKLGKYDNVNNISLAFDVFPTHNILNEHKCLIGVKTENSYGSGTSIYGRGSDNACLVFSHVASERAFDNVLTKDAVNHIELIANNGTPTTFIVGSVKNEIQWEHNDALNSYLYLFTNTWEGRTGTESLSRYYQIGKIVLIDSNGNIDVFVPSLRTADNVVGLYNTVDNVFITCNNSNYAKIGNSSCIYKVGNWT